MWFSLDENELELVKQALQSCKGDRPAEEKELALVKKLGEQQEGHPNDQAYRDAVRTRSSLDVDNDAVVSPGGDPGAWVHAWVWVRNDQAGIEEDDDDEG